MNISYLEKLLKDVAEGKVEIAEALNKLKKLPYEDMGYAKIDHHRGIRTGYPEAIFCEGKSPEQVAEIIKKMMQTTDNIIATRASYHVYKTVKAIAPQSVYHELPRIITLHRDKTIYAKGTIAVLSGGTADIPIAEEAAITAEMIGNRVDRIYDVGVAGIHRLLDQLERIRAANVVVVVAGMEGALASVVAGLCDRPVIAVPTSVGYGASFNGLAALLTMLNSCAAGVGVVNIDNGFGAGYLASNINRVNG
ncbi:MAG: nickel pincer cofactor biosynthesis protein LarB [Anaerovoracaceae bacterium]